VEHMTERYDFRMHDVTRIGHDLKIVLRPRGADR